MKIPNKEPEQWTIEDFLTFYRSIPLKKWTTGHYKDNEGRCCALGHIRNIPGAEYHTKAGISTRLYWLTCIKEDSSVVAINDAETEEARKLGKTPRARILRWLTKLKNDQKTSTT